MIEFRNVTFAYEKEKPVLRDLSFRIGKGESVGLIGANGAGKTSLIKLILGLLSCTEGTITVGDGKESVPVDRSHLAQVRRRAGCVLQDSDAQMFMPTVYEDLIFGPLNYGLTREETDRRVNEVLGRLNLMDLKFRHNHRISGGEKRMAAIAAILVMEPDIILMDEPTSNLDPFNRRTVIGTIRELSGTKIISSHDLDMILDTCGRVILLGDGAIAADGPAEEILRDETLLKNNRLELPLRFQK